MCVLINECLKKLSEKKKVSEEQVAEIVTCVSSTYRRDRYVVWKRFSRRVASLCASRCVITVIAMTIDRDAYHFVPV